MRIRSTSTVLVLLAILWIAIPSPASAQVGVLVGLNSANIKFDPDPDFDSERRTGFVAGLSFNAPIQDVFSVELDALFSQKGTNFTIPGELDGKIKLNYVDIPVLGRINLAGSGPARVHLLIGPSFNFKVSEKLEDEEGEVDEDEDSFERFETALVIGGGVTVSRFRVDVRYGLGLSNIVKDDENEGFTAKNRVFSVLVGFGS